MSPGPTDLILIKIFAGWYRGEGNLSQASAGEISAPEAKEISVMRLMAPTAAASIAVFAGGAPAIAQTAQAEQMPSVEIESTSVALGLGGSSGDGVLRLPNLGSNCSYAFKVDGFGAGIKVGIS